MHHCRSVYKEERKLERTASPARFPGWDRSERPLVRLAVCGSRRYVWSSVPAVSLS